MKIVTIECASWYQREDGLIQVITVRGKIVILNEVFSKIWLAIEDEIRMDDLKQKIGNMMSIEDMEQALSELTAAGMISVNSEQDEFNALFD